MKKKAPKLETRKLADLVPADYNPRTISDTALAGLKASIARWGIVQPVIVNKQTGNIVGGHQRVKALQALGATETQVLVVDLPEAEEKALNVTLNNQHIAGEFSASVLDLIGDIKLELPDLDAVTLGLDALVNNMSRFDVPQENKNIDEDEMKNTENECPKCGFKW